MQDIYAELPSLEELLRFGGCIADQQMVKSDMTPDGVSNVLRLCEALWRHPGDSNAPHAVLTSGKHSNGFVDTLRALSYTHVCSLLAYHLVRKIEEYEDEQMDTNPDLPLGIHWVVGSDHAGAVFSHDVARWLGARHDFTEKGPNGSQIWKRLTIESFEKVLQVEELVTTCGTLHAVRQGLTDGGKRKVSFKPYAATLIHRSDQYHVDEACTEPIIFLAHYDIQTWEPEKCPLCAQGSKAIKEPKKNWAELNNG